MSAKKASAAEASFSVDDDDDLPTVSAAGIAAAIAGDSLSSDTPHAASISIEIPSRGGAGNLSARSTGSSGSVGSNSSDQARGREDRDAEAAVQQVYPRPSSVTSLGKYKVSLDALEAVVSPRARKFYARQNDFIDDLEQTQKLTTSTPDATAEEDQNDPHAAQSLLVLRVSFLFNVLLTVLKFIISMQTGSLSILASLLDSIMDLVSGIILMVCAKIASSRDPHLYPGGKSRAEPVGIVVFSAVMGMVSLNVIMESVKTLVAKKTDAIVLSLFDILGVVAVVVCKGLLFLWCRKVPSAAAQAQADDHRNDISGNALSVCAVLLAYYVSGLWWVDATVAMAYSLFIIKTWGATGLGHAQELVGRAATPQFLQQLTHIVYDHAPGSPLKVDTVRAYHFGSNFLVEVDIVLPEDMTVKESHDLGESLQQKLERLPLVDRAFVHIDYEYDHNPTTEHKSV